MHVAHALARALIPGTDDKRQLDATCAAADGFAEACEQIGMFPDAIEAAFKTAGDQIEKGLPHCDSQIERMMLPWLVYRNYGDASSFPARVHIPKEEPALPQTATVIIPQFAIAKFRIDFAIVGRSRGHCKIIAIECDGADFHDVRKDRARDLYLSSLGIETFRCRGKEINSHNVWIARHAARRMSEWFAAISKAGSLA